MHFKYPNRSSKVLFKGIQFDHREHYYCWLTMMRKTRILINCTFDYFWRLYNVCSPLTLQYCNSILDILGYFLQYSTAVYAYVVLSPHVHTSSVQHQRYSFTDIVSIIMLCFITLCIFQYYPHIMYYVLWFIFSFLNSLLNDQHSVLEVR